MKIEIYFSLVFIYLILIAGTVEAATIIVGENSQANYTMIQEAINNAKDGDTILVHSGTYTENLVVNRSVSIKSNSNNPKDTVVQAANSGKHIFNITEDNVTISGFNITGANVFRKSPTAGVHIEEVNNSIISYNEFSNNVVGIDLHNSHNNVLENNIASANYRGISLTNSNGNDLINNDVFNNYFGIYFWGSKNNILSGNNASLNEEDGIWIEDDSSNNTLSNNMISNSDCGISLTEFSNNSIIAHNIVNSNLIGIEISGSSSNIVKNNSLSDNRRIGISIIRDSVNNTVKDNSLSNNSKGITAEDTDNQIYNTNNQIYNNEIKKSEIQNSDASQIPFTGPTLIIIIFGMICAFIRKKQL